MDNNPHKTKQRVCEDETFKFNVMVGGKGRQADNGKAPESSPICESSNYSEDELDKEATKITAMLVRTILMVGTMSKSISIR